jgi:hypothetical protein
MSGTRNQNDEKNEVRKDMRQNERKQPFYTRGFTTFVIVVSFLILAATGTAMFFTPRGRVAHWTNWTFLGLDKDQWSSVHLSVATLFIIMAVLHIFFNWKVLLGYLRLKRVKGLRLKKELAAALALGLFFVAGTLGGWPPFGMLIDAHGEIKDYWDRVSARAPSAHAEELTLAQFAQQIAMPIEEAEVSLREKGIQVGSENESLALLAEKHGLAPSELYAAIRPEGSDHERGGTEHTRSGLGKMTVIEYCNSQGLRVEDFLRALTNHGLEARRDSNLRELASAVGMAPGELVQKIGRPTPNLM